uniref:Retrotransposon protein, putative, Ty1-copia subclass n=1 Tax=Tanacetum cinerariifolium TaxID=118510 RepID=A0A699HQQ1_TANCI|nr:retrotransposon protein, putative, Ty1-copia subclass [Tanacetum cinerariifolium]
MKDLGEVAYSLRIKIYIDRSKRLIGLCQSAYIEKILKRFFMENSKRGSIPMQEKLKLSKSQGASTPAETGYLFILNGGVVDWKSTKQSIFPTLSAEDEYITASNASKDAVYVRKFIYGLGVVPAIKEPIRCIVTILEPLLSLMNKESLKVLDIIVPKFTIWVR